MRGGQADHRHAGAAGGFDAARGVLDHQAAVRGDAELAGGVEEEVRRRLGSPSHVGGEVDAGAEEAGDPQAAVRHGEQLLGHGGGDAGGVAPAHPLLKKLREPLSEAYLPLEQTGDDLQPLGHQGVRVPLDAILLLEQEDPRPLTQAGDQRFGARQVEGDAAPAEKLRLATVPDRLTVEDDAVAVEEDRFDHARNGGMLARRTDEDQPPLPPCCSARSRSASRRPRSVSFSSTSRLAGGRVLCSRSLCRRSSSKSPGLLTNLPESLYWGMPRLWEPIR